MPRHRAAVCAPADRPTRRSFLARSAAGTAAGLAALTRAGGVHAAGGRLRLAGIGVGGMGAADLGALASHPAVDVVALCDVDTPRLGAAGERHPAARRFADFRTMFRELADGIDAVHVSTPDHTHAAAAMTALDHGKHVYCQKPLTHDVFEARRLREAVAGTKLVTQMGTQIHSTTPYRTAVRAIRGGVIGRVREVHSWSNKTWGYDGPAPTPSPVPPTLDWNLWLGTAAERPYAEGHYHPGNWRRWCDFGCGTMGDMAIHILDPVWGSLDLTAPVAIESTSPPPPTASFGMRNQTRFTFPGTPFTTERFQLTWSDGGAMPDTTTWPLDAPAGGRLPLPDQGSMFIGEKGCLLLPHVAMPQLLPADTFAATALEPAPDGNHWHLFVDACLGGPPTTASFAYAGPLTEAVLLGTIANRFPGRPLTWAADTMTIPDHDAAAALLRRRYRSGFEVTRLA